MELYRCEENFGDCTSQDLSEGYRYTNYVKRIAVKIIDWKFFARVLDVPETYVQECSKSDSTTYINCCAVASLHLINNRRVSMSDWEYWKNKLMCFKDGRRVVEEIESERTIIRDNLLKNHVLFYELTKLLSSSWKELAHSLDLEYNSIKLIQMDFETDKERCYQVLQRSISASKTVDWLYWRNCLSSFEEGKRAIKYLETYHSTLCKPPVSNDEVIYHLVSRKDELSTKIYYCHHYDIEDDYKKLKQDSEKKLIVNIGCGQLKEFKGFSDWVECQKAYMSIYDSFKDTKTLNFTYQDCRVLKNIEKILSQRNGFAFKGFDHSKFHSYFGIAEKVSMDKDEIIAYISDEKILMYISFANKTNIHKQMNEQMKLIQLVESTQSCLQNASTIHIGVVLYDETLSMNGIENLCNTCKAKQLIISETTFENFEMLQSWFNFITNQCKNKVSFLKQSQDSSSIMDKKLKQSMFKFLSFHDPPIINKSRKLAGSDEEKDKVIVLTAQQMDILYSDKKKIFIRGGYGSGKTIILEKKLEHVLDMSNSSDIIYYRCCNPKVLLTKQHKLFNNASEKHKNLLIWDNPSISFKLSDLLQQVVNVWKDKKIVHVFIDEFNGSLLNEKEIERVNELLLHFQNSYIVISCQSMECSVESFEEHASRKLFEENYLPKSKLHFSLFDLSYSLRCSHKINEFIRETSLILENMAAYRKKDLLQHSNIDQELVIEKSIKYNISRECGHHIKGDLPSIYVIDGKISKEKYLLSASLGLLLKFIRKTNRFIIVTSDERMYDAIYSCFSTYDISWTNVFETFLQSSNCADFLLCDYASLRGFEYDNIIMLLSSNAKYLKYRMIECLTRATMNLHIVVVSSNEIDRAMQDIFTFWKKSNIVNWNYLEMKNDKLYLGDKIIGKIKTQFFKEQESCYAGGFQEKEFERKQDVFADDSLTLKLICQNNNTKLLDYLIDEDKINPNIALHVAAHCNRSVDIIKHIYNAYKIDIDKLNEEGETALHIACKRSNVDIVDTLLNCGADINKTSKNGVAPLHFAVKCGKIISMLMVHNADVNSKNNFGETPLHCAVAADSPNVVALLINLGGDLNSQSLKGETPLHLAAINNYCHIARILVKHSNNINFENKDRETALDLAFKNSSYDMIKLLEKSRGKKNYNKSGQSWMMIPQHLTCDCDAIFKEILTKLVSNETLDPKKHKEDDPSQSSPWQTWESMKRATYIAWDIGSLEMCKQIFKLSSAENIGNLVNFIVNDLDIKNLPVLFQALENSMDKVRMNTMLDYLSQLHFEHLNDLDKIFKKIYIKKDNKDKTTFTALHHAALINVSVHDLMKFLIQQNDVNVKDYYGNTPLHYAAIADAQDAVIILLDAGADINATNKNGFTSLHVAATFNSINVAVVLLKQKNVDYKIKNNVSKTAFDIAKENKFHDMKKLFRD